jgi:hypothetical protein
MRNNPEASETTYSILRSTGEEEKMVHPSVAGGGRGSKAGVDLGVAAVGTSNFQQLRNSHGILIPSFARKVGGHARVGNS